MVYTQNLQLHCFNSKTTILMSQKLGNVANTDDGLMSAEDSIDKRYVPFRLLNQMSGFIGKTTSITDHPSYIDLILIKGLKVLV